MDGFKVIYLKCDDIDVVVEKLKAAMDEYDMHLKGIDGNKYTFDRDRHYSRSFVIETVPNNWVTIIDEDQPRADEICIELSAAIQCFSLCMGNIKHVLYYNAYENGEQIGQYMSSLDYYEYPVDDEVENAYMGDAGIFERVLETEAAERLQKILDDCREGEVKAPEAYRCVLNVLGIVSDDDEEDEETVEEDGDDEIIRELFYVDFNSINIKTDNADEVKDILEQIVKDLGFKRVEDFNDDSGAKKGLFKKLISSVVESKRVSIYVSPVSDGWVTLAAEMERKRGSTEEDWEFMHIEDKLSRAAEKPVINIFANSEGWGFKVFKDGKAVSQFMSDIGEYCGEVICEIYDGIDCEKLNHLMDEELLNAEGINKTFEDFCSVMGIKNFKINIPMDYTDEEFYTDVINKLPDGDKFICMKFVEDK